MKRICDSASVRGILGIICVIAVMACYFAGASPAQAQPPTPTNLTATGGPALINLTWTTSSGATSYDVYRSTTGTQGSTPYASGITTTSYTDNVTPNVYTVYYYSVSAVNSGGTSAQSTEASAVPGPTGLTAAASGTSINLTWTAESGAAAYDIYRGTVSGGENPSPIVGNVTTTSYTDSGLTNGCTYYYVITAYVHTPNVPMSGYSNEANATLVPVAPSNLAGTFHASSPTEVNLSWTASTGATSYNVYRGTSSGGEGPTPYATGVTTTSYSDTSVNDTTVYFYEVAAVDSGGTSAMSNEVAVGDAPAAPTALSATGGPGLVALTWTASTGATSYNVYRGTSTNGESATPIATGLTTTSYSNTGLTTLADYFYKMSAVDSGGTSSQSTEASAIPGPTGLTATGATATSITLTWNAETGATSYSVYRSTTQGGEVAFGAPVSSTSYTDTSVASGTKYFYKVTASSYGLGPSAYSNEVSDTTIPAAPTGLSATLIMSPEQEVQLAWTGSTGATSYTIYRGTVSGGEQYLTSGVSGLSYTDTTGGDSPTYYYEVAAVDSSGTSAKSNEAITTPPTPTGVTATGGPLDVTLTWTGAAGTISYDIYRGTTQGGEGTTPYQTGITAQSYTDTGLAVFTQYYYKVSAVDAADTSSQSADVSAITGQTGLTATASGTTITLNWPPVTGAQVYDVYRGTASGQESSTAIIGVTTTSYEDTGLAYGTMYCYEIKDFEPSSKLSGYSNEACATTVPSPPTGLTATSGPGGQIVLSWNPSTGATSYNVYRGTSSGGESLTPIVTGLTATTYTNIGLAANTTYYYEVAAVNAAGTSGMSNQASATTPPAAPTSLTATGGVLQITLTWTGSTGATSYSLYRSPVSGGEVLIKTGISTTSYIDTGLASNTTYYYEVAAVSAAGTSAMSNEAHATTAPAPPTGLTATGGVQKVVLNWNASSGATSYSIYRSTGSGGEAAPPVASGINTTTYTDTGLADNTTYYYTVAAVSSSGTSGMSNQASATTAPAAPTGLTATGGQEQVALSWTPGTGDTSYNIFRGTGGGQESPTPVATGITAATYTDTGLADNTTYYYEVAAVGTSGTSGMSNEAHATTAPGAPTNLTAAYENDEISLAWTAGAGDTSYNVFRGTSSGGEGYTPIASGVATTSYITTGLLASDMTYCFKVDANGVSGTSGMSNVACVTTPPAPPSSLTATGGVAQVALNWTASTGATSYSIYRSTASGGEAAPPIASGITTTSYTDTGLAPNTTYYYTVAAVSGSGTSGMSNEATAITASAAPTGLTATGGVAQVALNWTASTGATSYNIYRGTVTGGEGTTPVETGITTTSYTDTGLASGATYFYSVTALNAGGESTQSNEASATTVAAAPTGLNAVPENGRAILTWAVPAGATAYNVYRGTATGTESTVPLTAGLLVPLYIDTSVTNGNAYYYTVTAIDSGGTSVQSSESSAALPIPAPWTPSDLSATASDMTVTLAWSGASAATTYNVYRGTVSGGESTTAVATGITTLAYTDTGLTDGAAYYYTVEGVTPATTTAASNESAATPQTAATGAPAGLTGVGGDGIVSLVWQQVAGATTYNVYRATAPGAETGSVLATGITVNQFTDTGLTDGTPYFYTATAVVGITESSFSNEASITPEPAAPQAPTDVTGSADNAEVALSWTASTGLVSYNVYRGTATGGEGTTPIASSLTATTYTDTLTDGASGYYTVAAVNGGGASPASNEAGVVIVPAPPTGLTATAGNNQVVLSWTASSGATSYIIYSGTAAIGTSTSASYTDNSAINGDTYTYTVAAVNAGGTSAPSSPVTVTLTPPAPTGLTATAGDALVSLSWTSSNGATSYDVYRSTASGAESKVVATPTGTTYINTGLINGVVYYYTVAAVNEGGTSSQSNEASAEPIGPPSAPTGLTAVETEGQIVLNWTAPPIATSYNVMRSTVQHAETLYESGITATTYTDTGVTSGTPYYYRVVAVNSYGPGGWSNEAWPRVPKGPTGVTATGGVQQVTLTWNSSVNATTYNIYRETTSFNSDPTPTTTGLTGSPYVDTGLAAGTTYYYRIASVDYTGTSIESWQVTALTVAAVPTGVVATPTNARVEITFSPAQGAYSYDIYRSTTSGGEGTTPYVTEVGQAGYTDTAVTNGTTYYYTVAGVNPTGTSAQSAEVSGTPMFPPPVPTGMTATASSGQIAIAWSATPTATSYSLYRSTVQHDETDYVDGITGTSYNDTAVTDGVIYYYRLVAVNVGGETWSAEFWPQAPPTPTGVTATAGLEQVTLAWTPSTGASTYNIYRETTSFDLDPTPTVTGVTGSPYIDTGLADGTTYYYRIAAVDFTGTSIESWQVTALTIPAVPTGVTATPGNARVAITFSSAQGAYTYDLYRSTTSGGEGTTPYQTGVGEAGYTDTAVTNGDTYYYTVASVNPTGTSAQSAEVTAEPTSAPPTPTGLTATGGTGQVALSWTATPTATSYDLYRSTASALETDYVDGITGTSYTDTAVSGATTYYYRLVAVNAGGETWSSEVSATTTAAAPTALAVTGENSRTILTWTVPAGATAYNVYRGSATGDEGTTPLAAGLSVPLYIDTSVSNGSAYYYDVAAVYAGGTSTASSEASVTLPTPAPSTPADLSATAGDTTVALAWSGSSSATSYNVYCGTASGGELSTAVATGVSTLGYTVTGLTDGTATYCTVAAVTPDFTTAASNEAAATAQSAATGAPTELTAVGEDGQAALVWVPVSGATAYNVYRGTAPGAETGTALATGVSANQYTDSGLTDGTPYFYTVTAVVGGTESSPSNEASATPEPAAPLAPADLTASAGDEFISLSWSASTGADTYNLYCGFASGGEGDAGIATGLTTTSYTDIGLPGGVTLYYTVAAVNGGGASPASNEASGTP